MVLLQSMTAASQYILSYVAKKLIKYEYVIESYSLMGTIVSPNKILLM